MWTYLLAGVAVLFGLLLLYTFCLRAAENDWTVDERTPPGPLHLPLIGSLTSVLSASNAGSWLDSLITTHGDVVRCCVPGQKVVLVRETPAKKDVKENSAAVHRGSLDRRSLLDVTFQHLVILVRRLGVKVDLTEEEMERCAQLSKAFFNFTVTVEDFALLIQSAENYRVALHQKKVSNLLGKLLKREVVLGEAEKTLLESALSQIDKFREEITRSSPALWLPLTRHSPSFFFERKRLSKSMAHLTHLLSQVFQLCGGKTESCDFEQFLLIYLTIGLSTTSPSRKPSRPRLPNPDRSCENSVVTIESSASFSSSCSSSSSSSCSSSEESFDIIGLRFFSTVDYLNLGQFDIPGNTLIIATARPLSS